LTQYIIHNYDSHSSIYQLENSQCIV